MSPKSGNRFWDKDMHEIKELKRVANMKDGDALQNMPAKGGPPVSNDVTLHRIRLIRMT